MIINLCNFHSDQFFHSIQSALCLTIINQIAAVVIVNLYKIATLSLEP